jgi:hypothetical protein
MFNLALLKQNLSVEKERPYFVILSGKLENKIRIYIAPFYEYS